MGAADAIMERQCTGSHGMAAGAQGSYVAGAQGIATRRMALSAERLAEILRALFPQ
jgi:hypothetical protein